MSLKNDEKKVISVVKTGQKVQIGLPKLCNYDDEDEEEEEQIAKPTLKNLNPIKTVENKKVTEKPRSGLLSMLPPPKSSQNPFLKKTPTPPNPTTFAPPVSKSSIGKDDEETTTTKGTTSSGLLLPRHMMGSKFAVKIADQDSEPTSSIRPSPSSALKSKAPIELPVTVKKTLVPEEDPDPFPEDRDDDDDDDYEEKEDEVSSRNEAAIGAQGAPVALDKDALLRLCGTQGGKKRKMEDIEFTEVSASAIVGDNQAELIKQVTSEYKPPSNKEYFTSSSKRTHHVTYLAKVAKERDQELRDSWSQGKFNRKMAREKYGF